MDLAEPVDLLVVGGGINGAGIARDAAGRGLSVVLCEQGDLANYTSSASSKLIHGGLRYLEQYEFRLVREALIEREILLRAAPHIVWPLRFILPHSPEQRPAWMIRLGLYLYDHLGGRRQLPRATRVNLRRDPVGAPLKAKFRTAFTYPDCWVEDARLVVLSALDAHERGAAILTRTRCNAARRANGLWYADLAPSFGGPVRLIRARALINAAGPWVARFLADQADLARPTRVRLVKGSHIIVPRLYDHDDPYVLQNRDGRVIFVIPCEGRYALIGTTEVDYQGDPAEARITRAEILYLCDAVSRYFRHALNPDRVLWTFAGVRPLYDDAKADLSAVTRDYAFDLDHMAGEAPLLSIFGGKVTTYRKLAEHALEKLQPVLGFAGRPWTATAPLARRRPAAWRLRGVRAQTAHGGAVASARSGPSLRACLRQPGRKAARGRSLARRSRRASGQRPVRGRARVSAPPRMGGYRDRHSVAALQARSARRGRIRSPVSRPGSAKAPRPPSAAARRVRSCDPGPRAPSCNVVAP